VESSRGGINRNRIKTIHDYEGIEKEYGRDNLPGANLEHYLGNSFVK